MTREDAMLHMILRREELKNSVGDLAEDIKAFDMAIEALEKTRWIPVSERFPEIGQYVLCSLIKAKDVKHRVIICEYKQEVWWSYVQAWMPLPQPYKAESEVSDAT